MGPAGARTPGVPMAIAALAEAFAACPEAGRSLVAFALAQA
jgi:hypothetical protein